MSAIALPVLRHARGLSLAHVAVKRGLPPSRSTLRLEFTELHRRPLRPPCPALDTLQQAWEVLGKARRDAPTLQALLTVLGRSYGLPARSGLPLPRLERQPDLRLWINDPEAMRHVLLELAGFWAVAVGTDRNPPPCPTSACVPDPFVYRHLGVVEDVCAAARTPLYTFLLLQFIPSSLPDQVRRRARPLLAQTPLPVGEELTALVARSLTWGPGWLEIMHEHFSHDPAGFLRACEAQGRLSVPCPAQLGSHLTFLEHTGSKKLSSTLALLALGLTPASITGTIRLRSLFRDFERPTDAAPHQPCYRSIRRVCLAAGSQEVATSHLCRKLPHRLWTASRYLEGFAAILNTIRTAWWNPYDLSDLLDLLAGIWRDHEELQPETGLSLWHQMRPGLPGLIRALERIPPSHREKAVELCRLLLVTYYSPARPSLIGEMPSILSRWCAPSTSKEIDVCRPLAKLYLHCAGPAKALTDHSSLVAPFEKAALRRTQRVGLEGGCESLHDIPFSLYEEVVRSCPKPFVLILQCLGTLPVHAWRDVWQMYREHPLVTFNLRTMPDAAAITLLEAVAENDEQAVPKKIREHVAGTVTLAPHVLSHYREEMIRHATAIKARILWHLTSCGLWRTFPHLRHPSRVEVHTLMMARSQEERRRPFNRFIRQLACLPDAEVLMDPRNLQWLESLPPTTRRVWLEGFAAESRLGKEGLVRLSPETNLQEKMKLGSYGATCLAPGGVCDYSTLAVTLDANKVVLYAKDQTGKVVGRQLVAISSDRQLVCFEIYPETVSAGLKHFFDVYTLALAHHLGLPLHRGGDYEIEAIHPLKWYDDGARVVRV